MGDDSTPRTVQTLRRGRDIMYKINTKRATNADFVVNQDHILCLKATTIGSLYYRKSKYYFQVHWHEKDEYGRNDFPYDGRSSVWA